MEKYTAYKPSGIKWIGDIPEHWVLINLKRVFSQRFSGTWGEEPKNNSNDRICLRVADFDYSNLRFKELPEYTIRNYKDDEICKYTLSKGSILIEKSGGGEKSPVGRSVFYDLKFDNALFANFLECLVVRDNYNPKFIVYYLSVMYSKRVIWKYVRQTTGIQNLTLSSLLSMESIYVPNISEQLSIVAFLEKATANIDAYIKQTEQEINTLNELKQAEIANVVTKGLNPNAPMKDSGIAWIGEIPDHWQCNQLRKYLKLVSIKNKPNEQLLSVTREQGVIVRNVESKEENHNFIPEDLSGYKYVRKGQFAINKMKSWQGSYGVSNFDGIVSPAYFVCELNNINKEFFSWAIRSKAFIGFFTQMSKGIRVDQWDLSPIALKQIPFFEPPITEQQQIVDYIESKTSKIEEYIVALKSEIEQIQEYKQRLISDVVTGKVDVRNVAVEKMEDIPEEEIEETEELENSEE